MKKLQRHMQLFGLCALMALPAAGQAQAPVPVQVQTPTAPSAQAPASRPRTRTAPQSTVSVDGRGAMFTTGWPVLAAGFETKLSSRKLAAVRAAIEERLRQQ